MSFAYLAVYTGDYLRDTRHLTPLKHGVYLLLLMHCWDQRGPLPLDEQDCAGIANCRSADEIEALRYILSKYFIRMDDGWYNRRIQKEIERANNISAVRSEAGKMGYQARAKQLPNKSQASASIPTTTTIPTTDPNIIKAKPTARAAPFILPEWIPIPQWNAWLEARQKARKPATEWAKKLAVRRLDDLRGQGHSPALVLAESAFNNWAGLFEPKGKK